MKSASNGVEALEKIRESKPNLVISDIMMPQMDGFALCRELKKTVETIKIPLILYSSSFTDLEDEWVEVPGDYMQSLVIK